MYVKAKKEIVFHLQDYEMFYKIRDMIEKLNKKESLTQDEIYSLLDLVNETINESQLVIEDTDMEDLKWIIQSNMDYNI